MEYPFAAQPLGHQIRNADVVRQIESAVGRLGKVVGVLHHFETVAFETPFPDLRCIDMRMRGDLVEEIAIELAELVDACFLRQRRAQQELRVVLAGGGHGELATGLEYPRDLPDGHFHIGNVFEHTIADHGLE